jgi:hypothetical protein
MILQRKNTAAQIQTADGILHPDIILAVSGIVRIHKQKMLHISFSYYHTKALYLAGFSPINIPGSGFIFKEEGRPVETDSQGKVLREAFPDYQFVKNRVVIDEDTESVIGNSDWWEKWIVDQIDMLDFQALPLKTEWKVDADYKFVVI